jgi:hypothetical protein
MRILSRLKISIVHLPPFESINYQASNQSDTKLPKTEKAIDDKMRGGIRRRREQKKEIEIRK